MAVSCLLWFLVNVFYCDHNIRIFLSGDEVQHNPHKHGLLHNRLLINHTASLQTVFYITVPWLDLVHLHHWSACNLIIRRTIAHDWPSMTSQVAAALCHWPWNCNFNSCAHLRPKRWGSSESHRIFLEQFYVCYCSCTDSEV